MTRGTGTVLVAWIIGVSSVGQGASGQSVVPRPVEREASAAIRLAQAGDNALRLDPYGLSFVFPGGWCRDERVAGWAVKELCGDGDGCTVRLVTDDGLIPQVSYVRSFVIDAAMEWWFVTTDSGVGKTARNKDFDEDEVVSAGGLYEWCELVDDLSADDGPYYHLRGCSQGPVVSCTLRIDD